MTAETALLVVRKTVLVDCPAEQAFALFTDGIGDWWPVETHSVSAMTEGSAPAKTALFRNGELLEVMADGSEAHWADVVERDAPHKLVLSWKVNPEAASATDVAVTFTPEGDKTRVELVHSGFERLGEAAQEGSDSYRGGWEGVLARFEEAANR